MFGLVSRREFDAHAAYCDRIHRDQENSFARMEQKIDDSERRLSDNQKSMHAENGERIAAVDRGINRITWGVISVLLSIVGFVFYLGLGHVTWHL
jgi:hypothetical protein